MAGEVGVVTVRAGRLRGVERDGVWQFLGVSYAASPSGRRRFLPPRPPEPWRGIRDAGEYGPVAPQPPAATGYIPNDPTAQDEDCLSLNVYTTGPQGEPRPVMVFLHGGSFRGGTGSSAMFRGAELVRRGVVLVTINYRLGALGFLAHPCLAGGGWPGYGNWGLWDQVAALRFVRSQIAAFGGDPAKVTLFGESAGAMSAADLLGAPAASGLFRRVILESGAALALPAAPAVSLAAELAAELGIAEPTRDALSAVPLAELLAAQAEVSARVDRGMGQPFQPVVDGGLLPVHPAAAIAAGSAAGVSVLAGTNRDEFRLFSFSLPELNELDRSRVEEIVGGYLAGSGVRPERLPAAAVLDAFAAARQARGEDTSPRELLEAFATDWLFRLPTLRLLEVHARSGGRGFAYRFDWESPFANGALRACHGLELPFVFGTYAHPVIGLFSGTGPEAAALSGAMVSAWTAFAATGDPSCPEVGAWPSYVPPERATMMLGRRIGIESAPAEAERAFLDRELGRYGADGPIEGAEPESVATLLE